MPSSVVGNSRIIASYNSGNETRTTVENNGGWAYTWSETDAIGVVKKTDNAYSVVPGMFSYAGSEFRGMMALSKGSTYYGFYPYSPTASTKEGNVTLTIPTSQLYVEGDTFAPGMAPSIGVGLSNADNELEMSFKAIGSYIRIPVVGKGVVTTVSLVVRNEEGIEQAIAGDVSVPYTAVNTDLTQDEKIKGTYVKDASATEITLYAEEGVELSTTEPHYFWFVIDPNADIASIELTFNGTVHAVRTGLPIGKVGTNRTLTIRQTASNDFNINVDEESDVYTISTPLHFLKYVYAATNGLKDVDEDLLTKEKTLKEAVIINDIDMATALDKITAAEAGEYKVSDYEYKVYGAYKSAQSIPSIGGGAEYNISAFDNSTETSPVTPMTISNLTVKDVNGLFVGNKTVENLTFENLTVNANAAPAETIDFIAKAPTVKNGIVYFLTNTTMAGIENVTFTGESKILGPANWKYEGTDVFAAMVKEDKVAYNYNSAKKTYSYEPLVFDNYNELPAGVQKYAVELKFQAGAGININDEGEEAKKNAKAVTLAQLKKYATVVNETNAPFMVYVNAFNGEGNGIDVLNFIDANVTSATKVDAWFSMFNSGVADPASYWTGRKANVLAYTDGVFADKSVAETLRFAVENATTIATEFDVTNRIYLSGTYKSWPVMTTTSKVLTVNGNGKKIEGAVIDGSNLETVNNRTTAYYTLFGATATVKELVVDDVKIKVRHFGAANVADEYTAAVATLASSVGTSSANNTVSNVVIDATAYAKGLYAGGIAATLAYNGYKTNTISGVTFTPYAGSFKDVVQACGDYAGNFTVTLATSKSSTIAYTAESTDVAYTLKIGSNSTIVSTENAAFGKVTVSTGSKVVDASDKYYLWNSEFMNKISILFDCVAPEMPAAANWVKGATFNFPAFVKAGAILPINVDDKSGTDGAQKTIVNIQYLNPLAE